MTNRIKSHILVVAGLLMICLFVFPVTSQTSSIGATVYNEYKYRVAVSIDSVFKCEVAPKESCSFQITKGKHVFGYRRDDGKFISDQNEIPSRFKELCIYLEEKGITYDDCELL